MMGLQYQYNEAAANNNMTRALEMWRKTGYVDPSISGDQSISGDPSISGYMSISGDPSIPGDLSISGDPSITSDITFFFYPSA